MARKFLTPIDLSALELQNAVIQNLPTGSLPASPANGRIAFDSTTQQLKVSVSGVWTALGTGTTPDATTGVKGIVQLAGDLGGAGTTAAAPLISANAITIGKLATSVTLASIATANASAASITASSQKITNLADPTASTDAATKNYVDSNANLVSDWKQSVRAVSDTNGTLASAFQNGSVIDGVTLATGDRILLVGQTTASENGIYTVNASGAPTRAADAATSTQLTIGARAFVESGTAYQFAIFTYVSGAFTAQVWTINYNFSPTAFISGGASNTIRIVVPSNTVTFNGTGVGLLGRTAAAQLDLATGTTAALGIAFGANEFQLYRSAASTLNIGNGGGNTALTIDPITGSNTATLNLVSRSTGTAATHSLQAVVGGGLTITVPIGNSIVASGASAFNVTPGGTTQTATLQLTARDGAGTGLTNLIQATTTGDLTITPGGTNGTIQLLPQGTGSVSVNSKRITSVSDPTSAQDAATKNYVDVAVQGLDPKASVVVATVGTETFTVAAGAVTLINGTSVDGVSPNVGDRILIKDAPAATGVGSVNSSQPGNGIYTVTNNTTNLTVARATDMDAWTEVPGAYTWVERGTVNADTAYISTADQGGGNLINTTPIKFVKFANATASQSAYYSALGSGTATTFSITQATHQLRASRGIVAQIQEESTGNVVDADISIASNGDATFTFATSQTLSGFRFTLIG